MILDNPVPRLVATYDGQPHKARSDYSELMVPHYCSGQHLFLLIWRSEFKFCSHQSSPKRHPLQATKHFDSQIWFEIHPKYEYLRFGTLREGDRIVLYYFKKNHIYDICDGQLHSCPCCPQSVRVPVRHESAGPSQSGRLRTVRWQHLRSGSTGFSYR